MAFHEHQVRARGALLHHRHLSRVHRLLEREQDRAVPRRVEGIRALAADRARGALVNAPTTEGETPLDWAVADGRDSLATRLRELGGRPGDSLPRAAIYLAVKTGDAARVRDPALVRLRGRCVMTTFDPDTLAQDMDVLRRIREWSRVPVLIASVRDSNGLLVDQMELGPARAGDFPFSWDGTNSKGDAVPAGRYRVSVAAKDATGSLNQDWMP